MDASVFIIFEKTMSQLAVIPYIIRTAVMGFLLKNLNALLNRFTMKTVSSWRRIKANVWIPSIEFKLNALFSVE